MDCVNLSVIPQFGGTCWFNAILMIALYSQETRKVLIKSSKTWDTNNKFLMILKAIAVKYYNKSDKVQALFNKIKPEIILFKMIKTYNDINLLNALKEFIKKNVSNLGWLDNYITKFFRFINLKCMDITYYNGLYLLNFDKVISMKANTNGLIDIGMNRTYLNHDKLIKETKKELEEIPDVLCVFHHNVNTLISSTFFSNYMGLSKEEQAIFNPEYNKYKFKIKGLDTYDDIIYLNGHKYKLDATTLCNYNVGAINHAIAGITCKGDRYVYNGWTKQSTDPAFKNEGVENNNPCALMKYNWDLKKDNPFCLNPISCNLDFLQPYEKSGLCFSFAKGLRTLIYVRVDEKFDSNIKEKVKSNLNPSNISELLKDIHDVKNLTDNELKFQLEQLGVYLVPNYYYSTEILQNLLYDALKKYYNINSDYKSSAKKSSIDNNYDKLIKLKKPELIKLAMKKNPKINYIYKTKPQIIQMILGTELSNKNDLLTKVKSKYPFIKCLNKYNKKELEFLLYYYK